MKITIAFLICICLLSFLTACRTENKNLSPAEAINKQSVSRFPVFLVGVWEARVSKNSQWGFKFETDGKITKIIHSLAGPIKLSDGGVYTPGRIEGTYATFIPGQCRANYDPSTKILTVKVELDYYEMKLPNGTLTGRCEDVFEGPVSADSDTWEVEWRNYTYLDGANEPPRDIIDANPVNLTFKKLDLPNH